MVPVSAARGPRVGPLPQEEWDADVRAALETGGAALRTQWVPNGVTTLLRHPSLAGAFLAYNGVLVNRSVLDDRARELVILRVAWRSGSTYEWLQHARIAGRYDISPAELAAIADGAAAGGWTDREAALLSATDQLMDGYTVDDETWARLAEDLDERQLVELVFVVGTYACLAMAFISLGVPLDPELETLDALPRPRPGDSR